MIVEAIEYRREQSYGRTRPLVLLCESPDGSRSEYVVKLKNASEIGVFALVAEWICADLAHELNLVTPEKAAVNIQREFAEAVPNESARKRLLASLGTNFGSKLLTGGYSTWPRSKPLTKALRRAATDILCFDVFVQNPDRREDKPNLLWKAEDLIVLDHEMAFSFVFGITSKEPWDDLFATGIRRHLFFSALKRNLEPLEPFRGAVEALADEFLDRVFAEIPAEWQIKSTLDNVRTYLSKRRANAADWLDGVRKELA